MINDVIRVYFYWHSFLSVTVATVHHGAKRNMTDLGIQFFDTHACLRKIYSEIQTSFAVRYLH